MKPLLLIARKELVRQWTNPLVLTLTIVVPLLMATLISVVFGDLMVGRTVSDKRIPVGVVNYDQGGGWGNLGNEFVRAMIPSQGEDALLSDPLFDLFDVRELENEEEARQQVERGKLVAALVIPTDFSESLAAKESGSVSLYVNGRYEMSGVAVESVVGTLADLSSRGEITLRTAVMGLLDYSRTKVQFESGRLDDQLIDLAHEAIDSETNLIAIERSGGEIWSARVAWRRYLAAAIAVLFAGFLALSGSASLTVEQAQHTLRRMRAAPVRRGAIVGGMALGWYVSVLSQLLLLSGGILAVEKLTTKGGQQPILVEGLIPLIVVTPLAATGVAAVLAALADSYSQAISRGGAALMVMGLIGGVFFPETMLPGWLQWISRLTYPYWAMDGFTRLATGAGVVAVLPHVVVLVAMGCLGLAFADWLVRRRNGVD